MNPVDLYDEADLLLCSELDIHYENGEILPYFETVFRDQQFHFCIAVCPDIRIPEYQEYFIVYNHIFPQNADKIARIKFRSPEYVLPLKHLKSIWILNDQMKIYLQKILNSQSVYSPDRSVWQSMIERFNFELDDDILPVNLPVPDYENSL